MCSRPAPAAPVGAADGEIVLDLGTQPSSELFPKVSDPGPDPLFPLRMWLCAGCGLAQLADDADVPEEVMGVQPAALLAQRREAVDELVAAGVLPARRHGRGVPQPARRHLARPAGEHGFTGAAGTETPADVVVDGCFGVMHEPDQHAALQARTAAVRPGGRLVLQFHSLHAIMAGAQWNALRLGHYAYYSTPAMVGMLARVRAHRHLRRTGSRSTAARSCCRPGAPASGPRSTPPRSTPWSPPSSRRACCARTGVGRLQDSVRRTARRAARAAGGAADGRAGASYGYAAASRAVSLLRLAGLDSSLLAGVADASPAKQDRRMPGTDIPILPPDELVAAAPDVVLVFVSELVEEARGRCPRWSAPAARGWTPAPGGSPDVRRRESGVGDEPRDPTGTLPGPASP